MNILNISFAIIELDSKDTPACRWTSRRSLPMWSTQSLSRSPLRRRHSSMRVSEKHYIYYIRCIYIYTYIKCMNVSFWIWGCLNIRGLSNSDLFREVVGYTCHLQAPEASMMHLTPKDWPKFLWFCLWISWCADHSCFKMIHFPESQGTTRSNGLQVCPCACVPCLPLPIWPGRCFWSCASARSRKQGEGVWCSAEFCQASMDWRHVWEIPVLSMPSI